MLIYADSSIRSRKVDKIECPLVSMDNCIFYTPKEIYNEKNSPKLIPINYALTYHNGEYYFFIYDIPSDRDYFVANCEEFTSMKVLHITENCALDIINKNGEYDYWSVIFNSWFNYLHYYIFVGNEIHNRIIRYDIKKVGDDYYAPRGNCPADFDMKEGNDPFIFLHNQKKIFTASKMVINPIGHREYLINKLL